LWLPIEVLQHAIGGKFCERRCVNPRRETSHAPCHAKRLTHEAIEKRTAGTRRARVLPGVTQLRGDLVLARLRRIEPAGDEEQMLDRGLAGPGAEDSCCLPGSGVASCEDAEDFLARVAGGTSVFGGIQHLDAVAGADVEDLGGFEERP